MLENNIKSNFIIQNIFSFASQEIKFNLVKYNKNLQKKLDINLIDYKNLSGKYIVYEENGKGKEYNYKDELIFEGEYLKGKRNGKGKEYNYDGKLLFEGEYLKGKRNGKGKEYINGELKFEGEYLNGKRWNGKGFKGFNNIIYVLKNGNGNIKEYDDYGKLLFESEYLK